MMTAERNEVNISLAAPNPIPPANLSSVLRYWAEHAPQRPCLAFWASDSKITRLRYGDFYARVQRVAEGLNALGLRPGDRCVIHLENSVAFMLAFWACHELQAIAVPTVVAAAEDELRFILGHCEPALVFVGTSDIGKVTRACSRLSSRPTIVVDSPETEDPSLHPMDDLPGSSQYVAGGEPTDVACILYTSGATARPKGVMLSHAGSLFAGETLGQHLRIRPDDRVLTCLPLFHVNGLYLQMLPTLMAGAELILTPRFSVSQYWRWVNTFDVTVAHLVAGPIRLLVDREPSALDRAHRLRVMTFGLPLDDQEICQFEERFGVPLSMGWGLTESCCGGTHMPLYAGRRPGYQAIGRAELGWEVRVVGEAGDELPRGAIGELVIRSRGLMLGYYQDPIGTAAALRDGWLLTGDLGFADDENYFHFAARKKDMLKTDGENVAASDVERVLNEHAAVVESAVVGFPDRIRGEVGYAFVVVDPQLNLDLKELSAFCQARLPKFKVPVEFEIRSSLPKTSIGKVAKGRLLAKTDPRASMMSDTDIA